MPNIGSFTKNNGSQVGHPQKNTFIEANVYSIAVNYETKFRGKKVCFIK